MPTLWRTPAANSSIEYGAQASIKFDLKNNGPAAIAATDSIFYMLPTGTINVVTGSAIASGATITVDLGPVLTNNNTGAEQTVDFCLTLLPQSVITVGGNPVSVTYNDAMGTNDTSCNIVTIKSNPSSIFDAKTTKETLSLYPNPATSQVSFNVALEKPATVVAIVKDITGREVLTKNFGSMQTGTSAALELNIANLNSGIYVVEVIAGDKKFVGKVTKKN
ncbi:MAG: T9SS type A sorting domain-containing protein [Sphingobacteriales bacterium]|nr:MAG: T9SS type A sorting domain-containing protein [Sphingobacteriales bacterium]